MVIIDILYLISKGVVYDRITCIVVMLMGVENFRLKKCAFFEGVRVRRICTLGWDLGIHYHDNGCIYSKTALKETVFVILKTQNLGLVHCKQCLFYP